MLLSLSGYFFQADSKYPAGQDPTILDGRRGMLTLVFNSDRDRLERLAARTVNLRTSSATPNEPYYIPEGAVQIVCGPDGKRFVVERVGYEELCNALGVEEGYDRPYDMEL